MKEVTRERNRIFFKAKTYVFPTSVWEEKWSSNLIVSVFCTLYFKRLQAKIPEYHFAPCRISCWWCITPEKIMKNVHSRTLVSSTFHIRTTKWIWRWKSWYKKKSYKNTLVSYYSFVPFIYVLHLHVIPHLLSYSFFTCNRGLDQSLDIQKHVIVLRLKDIHNTQVYKKTAWDIEHEHA